MSILKQLARSKILLNSMRTMGDLRIRDAFPFWITGGLGLVILILLAYFAMPEPAIEYTRP